MKTVTFASRLFHAALLMAAVVTAALSLATLLDEYHQYLELFSHFRAQYLAVALLLGLVLLLARRFRLAVLMLAIAGVNATLVVPWYVAETGVAAEETLTVLLANVWIRNDDAAALIAILDREDPDLFFVQELTPAFSEQLRAVESRYPYQLTDARRNPYGIGVWSQRPLESAAAIAVAPWDLPTLAVTVDFDGAPLRLFSTHPPQPLGTANYAARNRQLAAVADLVAATPGSAVLIGDLNISMWAANYRALERRTGLVNARRGFGVLPTWPEFFPPGRIPIDHALLSTDLVAVDTRIPGDTGSDHKPLLVDIARRSRSP